jgi:predicted transcriptional regulator
MTLENLIGICGLEPVLVPDPQAEVAGAYTSDLLSDVMAHCPDGAVLITVQNHTNTVAVCTLVGAPAILVAHRRDIPDEMRAVAEREGIALLRTADDQFAASLKVGKALSIAV